MSSIITLRAGDTEPLEFTIGANSAGAAISNLDDVSSVAFYAREEDAGTNHVDGATVTVASSASRRCSFDPASNKSGGGNAFDAPGTYLCYALVTWADGDTTRHPGDGWLIVEVTASYE